MGCGKDNVPFGDGQYMVLAPCNLKQIWEMIIWQFTAIGGLPYFCGKMGVYVVIYAYWTTNVQ